MMNGRFQAWLARLGWEKKVLLYAGALSLLPLLALTIGAPPEAPARTTAPDVDTLIPRGFVLVPIEVQNYEALDSILGRFGTVDLFQAAAESRRLVARNVRILRAPQNPSHFAVLVSEESSGEILKSGGVFTVIVKRKGEDGTEFVKNKSAKRRKIVYEGD